MGCCSRSSPASISSAACASCAAACAMPAVPIRCSASIRAAPHFTLAPTALAALVAARAGARCFITDPARAARATQTPAAGRVALARGTERAPRCHGRAHAGRTHAPAARRIRRRFGPGDARRSGPAAGTPRRSARAARAPRALSRACAISTTKSKITNASCRRSRPCWTSSSSSCACASAASRRCNAASTITVRRRRVARCGWPRPRPAPKDSRTCCANGSPRLPCPSPCGAASCAAARSRIAPRPAGHCGRPANAGHASAGEMPALVEHLRARLGAAAVYGIAPRLGTPPRERLVRGRTENARKRGHPYLMTKRCRPALHRFRH